MEPGFETHDTWKTKLIDGEELQQQLFDTPSSL